MGSFMTLMACNDILRRYAKPVMGFVQINEKLMRRNIFRWIRLDVICYRPQFFKLDWGRCGILSK